MTWLCGRILKLMGWRFVGSPPDAPKMVVVGYPHTSNWDFILFLGVLSIFDLKVRFLATAPLFRGPFGWLLRWWGGMPVAQTGHYGLVDAAVEVFDSHDEMILVIAPEGTRAKTQTWKSGFWRIAEAADVPVAMAFIDGEGRTVGFGPSARIDGELDTWMALAADFYADKSGVKPQNRGPVTL